MYEKRLGDRVRRGMGLGVVGFRNICFNFLHFVQHCGIALGLATAPVGIPGV
jgi:hypothetical protein